MAEICENFGLNDVDLEYGDAEYQNLTNYKLFQQTFKQRIQSGNPKVPQPKLMMLVAAKWREFQALAANANAEAEQEAAPAEEPEGKVLQLRRLQLPSIKSWFSSFEMMLLYIQILYFRRRSTQARSWSQAFKELQKSR